MLLIKLMDPIWDANVHTTYQALHGKSCSIPTTIITKPRTGDHLHGLKHAVILRENKAAVPVNLPAPIQTAPAGMGARKTAPARTRIHNLVEVPKAAIATTMIATTTITTTRKKVQIHQIQTSRKPPQTPKMKPTSQKNAEPAPRPTNPKPPPQSAGKQEAKALNEQARQDQQITAPLQLLLYLH